MGQIDLGQKRKWKVGLGWCEDHVVGQTCIDRRHDITSRQLDFSIFFSDLGQFDLPPITSSCRGVTTQPLRYRDIRPLRRRKWGQGGDGTFLRTVSARRFRDLFRRASRGRLKYTNAPLRATPSPAPPRYGAIDRQRVRARGRERAGSVVRATRTHEETHAETRAGGGGSPPPNSWTVAIFPPQSWTRI